MPLPKERRAELCAAKTLREGDTSFKPRGVANRAAYEGMKEELENEQTGSIPMRPQKQIGLSERDGRAGHVSNQTEHATTAWTSCHGGKTSVSCSKGRCSELDVGREGHRVHRSQGR